MKLLLDEFFLMFNLLWFEILLVFFLLLDSFFRYFSDINFSIFCVRKMGKHFVIKFHDFCNWNHLWSRKFELEIRSVGSLFIIMLQNFRTFGWHCMWSPNDPCRLKLYNITWMEIGMNWATNEKKTSHLGMKLKHNIWNVLKMHAKQFCNSMAHIL